jgi:hypothetical protein
VPLLSPDPDAAPATIDGHTRVAVTRTRLLDDGEYPPGLLLADCSCEGTYTVVEDAFPTEFDALEREHVRHVQRVHAAEADARCVDGRAVDVVDGQEPGGGSYAACGFCGYRGPTSAELYAIWDARRHNEAADARAEAAVDAEVPDFACEGCGTVLSTHHDNELCDECMAAAVCERCSTHVGTEEIGRNNGTCDTCAGSLDDAPEWTLS